MFVLLNMTCGACGVEKVLLCAEHYFLASCKTDADTVCMDDGVESC